MQCPTCEDTESQQRLSPNDDGSVGYRCSACGRIYISPPIDLATMGDRLNELKHQQEVLGKLIADIESQIMRARGEQADAGRRLD